MDVSIIICTHNGADALGGTLESLRRIDVPSGWEVELLLVDNACLGRSEAYISYQWADLETVCWMGLLSNSTDCPESPKQKCFP